MNPYIKFILVVLAAGIMTRVTYYFFEKGEDLYFNHQSFKMQQIFEDTTRYNILYIGSSRTHLSINPRTVDSITGLKSYNAGINGANIFEFKTILDGYLIHHENPELLILNLDANSFEVKQYISNPLSYFEVINNPAVKSAFKNEKEYHTVFIEKIPELSIIYYNDYQKSFALQGLMGKNEVNEDKAFEYNGFIANGYSCVDSMHSLGYKYQKIEIQNNAVKWLQDIINICVKRNIQVILTYAPEYNFHLQQYYTNFSYAMSTIKTFAEVNKIKFYRDDSLPLCSNKCFFANYGHLNTFGAYAYSKVLGQRLKVIF